MKMYRLALAAVVLLSGCSAIDPLALTSVAAQSASANAFDAGDFTFTKPASWSIQPATIQNSIASFKTDGGSMVIGFTKAAATLSIDEIASTLQKSTSVRTFNTLDWITLGGERAVYVTSTVSSGGNTSLAGELIVVRAAAEYDMLLLARTDMGRQVAIDADSSIQSVKSSWAWKPGASAEAAPAAPVPVSQGPDCTSLKAELNQALAALARQEAAEVSDAYRNAGATGSQRGAAAAKAISDRYARERASRQAAYQGACPGQ